MPLLYLPRRESISWAIKVQTRTLVKGRENPAKPLWLHSLWVWGERLRGPSDCRAGDVPRSGKGESLQSSSNTSLFGGWVRACVFMFSLLLMRFNLKLFKNAELCLWPHWSCMDMTAMMLLFLHYLTHGSPHLCPPRSWNYLKSDQTPLLVMWKSSTALCW